MEDTPRLEDHPKWVAAPAFLKELVLLLERLVPDMVKQPVALLRDYSPSLHAALISITIITMFFVLYVAVHVKLYHRLASHYPILQVLFKGKKDSANAASKSKTLGTRGRTRTSTQYRSSKFAGSRNVRAPKTARSTPLSATGEETTSATLRSSTFTAGASGGGAQTQSPDER